MRIGLFTDTYLPNINGVVSSVELLRKKLEEKGHVVYVITSYSGVFEIKEEGRIIRLPGIEIKKLYCYSLAQPMHLFFIERLKELKLDLIHCHTEFGVGIFASITSKTLHIPMVKTYHTTYEDYTHYINPIDSETLEVGLKRVISTLSKTYGNDCKALIAPSKKTKDLLLSYNVKTPIEVIPTGIEIDRFKYIKENDDEINRIKKEEYKINDEKIVLYVGRIAQEKSIDLLIKAFKKVKENNLKLKLVIIGDGPGINELKKLAKSLDLNDIVYFLGKKPYDHIHYYYQSASCFASASTSETQGMTYVEALASGLVIFGRYDEVLEDLIIENENGYRFDNEDEMFDKLKIFDSLSEEEVNKMSKKAIETSNIYDAEEFVENVEKLYEKVINDFEKSYTITRVKLKDDIVELSVKLGDEDEEKLYVSLDNYYGQGLRLNQKMSFETYDDLKDKEVEAIAYNKCLKKLSNKDYTVKQIYDFLNNKCELSIDKANHIVDKLKSLNLLDDYKYAITKHSFLDRALHSQRSMINKLKKDGVPLDIIENVVIKDIDNELLKAKSLAKKYQNSIHNKSLNLKKQTIIKKLVSNGFNYDIAKEATNLLDFTNETFEEKDLLKKEANIQYKKLVKKYKGYELRNKMYYSLFSKGFTSEAIYALIDEMELNDE